MIPDAWRDERVEKADYPRQHDCWAWVALCVVSFLCPGPKREARHDGRLFVQACKLCDSTAGVHDIKNDRRQSCVEALSRMFRQPIILYTSVVATASSVSVVPRVQLVARARPSESKLLLCPRKSSGGRGGWKMSSLALEGSVCVQTNRDAGRPCADRVLLVGHRPNRDGGRRLLQSAHRQPVHLMKPKESVTARRWYVERGCCPPRLHSGGPQSTHH